MRPMKSLATVLAAITSLSLVGCLERGKSRTVVTPPPPKPAVTAKTQSPVPEKAPEPLSAPQTRVQLPSPQPLNPAALVANPEPAPAPQPARARTHRIMRTGPAVAAAPPAPGTTPPAADTSQAPASAPPVVEERPRLQPILPPEEVRRIQDTIAGRAREIHERLSQVRARPASPEESMVGRIRSLLGLSDEAAKRGDMTQADALSEKALVLARGLEVAR